MFVEKFKRAQILVDSDKFLRSLQYLRRKIRFCIEFIIEQTIEESTIAGYKEADKP